MTPHIEHFKVPGEPGWKVSVKLDISPDEVVLIWDHGMADLNIVTWKGKDHPFSDFYDADKLHHTLWPQDGDILSTYELRDFVRLLRGGFRHFEQFFMAENRKDPSFQRPWNFFDENDERFAHTWIVAPTKSGKTTLLSALINEDLDKVKRGEASVMVIDSQNEHLSHNLPRLARFARGGDLYGKLIYLAPDLNYPLALNIFDFTGYQRLDRNERLELLNTVREMLMFFIGALIGEASGHMRNVIGYALEALVLIPDATVFTFKDLLAKGGLAALTDKYPSLKTLDKDTAQFLTTGMFEGGYGQSLGAVRSRLDAITRGAFSKATFAQPQNRLNLFELLKEPYVIVVNTDSKRLGVETCALFGRFFLASLLGVVNRRIGGGLPVYVYADEAQQYIAQEEVIVTLVNEARRQNVGLTLAHHRMSDIKLATVSSALQSTAIHIDPVHGKRHHWRVIVNQGDPVEMVPPNINFKRMPQMDNAQWQDIMDGMHACFSPPPKEQPKKNNSPPPPDDDATTDR